MEELKLEQYEGINLVYISDVFDEDIQVGTKDCLTILLYAEDSNKRFMIYDDLGQERFFTYSQFNEYFKLKK